MSGGARRSRLAGVLAAMFLAASLGAPPGASGADPSPVVHWAFDEGSGSVAADGTGKGHDLALTSTDWITDGQLDDAIHFRGTTSSGALAPAAGFHPEVMTVAFWVRGDPDSPPADGSVIIEQGRTGDCSSAAWGIYAKGTAFEVGWLEASDGIPRLVEIPSSPGFELWDGAWHHVSLVVPDNYYYQMSALIDRRPTTFTPHPPSFDYASMATDALAVGHPAAACPSAPRFRGDVDEVLIFDTDLNMEQLGGLLPPVPSTLGLTGPTSVLAVDGACYQATVTPTPYYGYVTFSATPASGPATLRADVSANPAGHFLGCFDLVAGTYRIDATFNQGWPVQDSSGQPITLTVSRRPTQVVNVGGRDFLSTEPIRIEATVAATDGYPRGAVDFFDTTGGGRTFLGSADLQWLGTAGHETAFLDLPARQPGTYALEADYPGTAERFLPSTGTGSVTVTQGAVPGTVTINGGAAATRDANVQLDISAVSGAIAVGVGNAPDSLKVFLPPVTSTTWSLTDRQYGGDPLEGLKTVTVRWQASDFSWSAGSTASIYYDATAPTVGSVAAGWTKGSSVPVAGPTMRLAWSGHDDGSGVAHYEVEQSIDGGAYAAVSGNVPSASLPVTVTSGHSYGFRVRAADAAGNVGVWSYGRTTRFTEFRDSARSIHYHGTWHVTSSTSYLGGRERYSTSAGATASISFTGRSFAWVGTTGPSRGTAKVYVNGALVATLNLHAATTSSRKLLFTKSWTTTAKRTIVIRVSGTSGHPRVDVDSLFAGS